MTSTVTAKRRVNAPVLFVGMVSMFAAQAVSLRLPYPLRKLTVVGVIERGRSLRLLNETTQAISIGRKVAGQYLQCHSAAELRIFRQIHLAHPARAELRDDSVLRDGLVDESHFFNSAFQFRTSDG